VRLSLSAVYPRDFDATTPTEIFENNINIGGFPSPVEFWIPLASAAYRTSNHTSLNPSFRPQSHFFLLSLFLFSAYYIIDKSTFRHVCPIPDLIPFRLRLMYNGHHLPYSSSFYSSQFSSRNYTRTAYPTLVLRLLSFISSGLCRPLIRSFCHLC